MLDIRKLVIIGIHSENSSWVAFTLQNRFGFGISKKKMQAGVDPNQEQNR